MLKLDGPVGSSSESCFLKSAKHGNTTICILPFQVVLLITNGKQTAITSPDEAGPIDASTELKDRGVYVIVLGIGQVDVIEPWNYASNAQEVLQVDDFSQLDSKVKEVSETLCPCKF